MRSSSYDSNIHRSSSTLFVDTVENAVRSLQILGRDLEALDTEITADGIDH